MRAYVAAVAKSPLELPLSLVYLCALGPLPFCACLARAGKRHRAAVSARSHALHRTSADPMAIARLQETRFP